MSSEPPLEIPPGYERWIRYGADWTMLISPYMILYFAFVFAVGGASIGSTAMARREAEDPASLGRRAGCRR